MKRAAYSELHATQCVQYPESNRYSVVWQTRSPGKAATASSNESPQPSPASG